MKHKYKSDCLCSSCIDYWNKNIERLEEKPLKKKFKKKKKQKEYPDDSAGMEYIQSQLDGY